MNKYERMRLALKKIRRKNKAYKKFVVCVKIDGDSFSECFDQDNLKVSKGEQR